MAIRAVGMDKKLGKDVTVSQSTCGAQRKREHSFNLFCPLP